MLELMVPETQKYLVYIASKGIDVFDHDFIKKVTSGAVRPEDVPEDERWKHQIIMDIKADDNMLEQFAIYKENINRQKENYDALVMRLYQTKVEMRKQAK